jgi:hypothetical protein
MASRWNDFDRENPNNAERNLSHYDFDHKKYHIDNPKHEFRPTD